MILIVVYLVAIVAANLLVATYGPAVTIFNAFVFIALDLSTRDALHERWKGRGLWWRMAALIATGSGLSYILNANAGPIALASFAAFAAAGVVDAITYTLLRDKAYLVKSNGSNVLSAAVDSVVFPAVAFGLPIMWSIVIGQFIAKVAGGFIWSLILNRANKPANVLTVR